MHPNFMEVSVLHTASLPDPQLQLTAVGLKYKPTACQVCVDPTITEPSEHVVGCAFPLQAGTQPLACPTADSMGWQMQVWTLEGTWQGQAGFLAGRAA